MRVGCDENLPVAPHTALAGVVAPSRAPQREDLLAVVVAGER